MADDLTKQIEEQAQIMRNKDSYIKRLQAQIQEQTNELNRANQKLKQQTDKTVNDMLKALAEIFTKVDAGYVDFKDDMSDSRQMSYTLSKFKTTIQLLNIEVMVPNLLENYDIDSMEVTDVVPTADKSLDKKVVHIDRVGFRNKVTRVVLIQPQVITYKYDKALDVEGMSNQEKAKAAMQALNNVLGNRSDGSAVAEDSSLGEEMLQMMDDLIPNQYNLPEVDEANEQKKVAKKLSNKAQRAEDAKTEAMRKADEARKEADRLYMEAAEAEEKKTELENIAQAAIERKEAEIAAEEERKRREEEERKRREEEERRRREEEERLRREEEERQAAAAKAEAARLAEEAAAERARIEAERAAKQAEMDEKRRRLDEIKAEAARRAEEARRAAEEAERQAREEEERLLAELEAENQEQDKMLAEKAEAAKLANEHAQKLNNKINGIEEQPKVEETKPTEPVEDNNDIEIPIIADTIDNIPQEEIRVQQEEQKRGLFGRRDKKEEKKSQSSSAWDDIALRKQEKEREEAKRREKMKQAQYDPYGANSYYNQPVEETEVKKKRSNR